MYKNDSWINDCIILLLSLIVIVLLFRNCAEGIEIENTLWQYQHTKYDVIVYYGFANDEVYLVQDNYAYEFPTRLQAWAFYDTVTSIAVMYNYYEGSWGYLISYFNKKKAVQLGMTNLLIPYVWEYKLTLMGDLF
jgi:hypothetical protein